MAIEPQDTLDMDSDVPQEIDMGETGTVVPDEVALQKAKKLAFAKGETNFLDLYPQFKDSQLERILRTELSHRKMAEDQVLRMEMALDIMNEAEGAGLTYSPELPAMLVNTPVESLDPDTIIEEMFAQKFVQTVAKVSLGDEGDAGAMSQAISEDPDSFYDDLDTAQKIVVKQELFKGVAQEIQTRFQDMGWGETIGDFAVTWLPGRTMFNEFNEKTSEGAAGWLQGGQMDQYISNLYMMEPREAAQKFKADAEAIFRSNGFEALDFVNQVLNWSSSEKNLQTMWNIVDAADITGVAGGVARRPLTAAGRAVRRKLGYSVKANADPKASLDTHLVVNGDFNDAVGAKVSEILTSADPNMTPKAREAELKKLMPQLLDSSAPAQNPGNLTNLQSARIIESLRKTDTALGQIFYDTQNVSRVGAQALEEMVSEATWRFHTTHPNMEDRVLAATTIRNSETSAFGFDYIAFDLGMHGAKPFRTEKEAIRHATQYFGLEPKTYSVVQLPDTDKFAIRITQNFDETSPTVRGKRIETSNKTPDGKAQIWLSLIRGPQGTLSADNMEARIAAVLGNSRAVNLLKEAAKPISENLKKHQVKRLSEILEDNQKQTTVYNVKNPWTNDVTKKEFAGAWHNTFEEYQQAYYKKYKEMPTQTEIEAYFTYRRIHDWDLMGRNFAVVKDKARQGLHELRVAFPQKHPNSGNQPFKTKPRKPGSQPRNKPRPEELYGPEYIEAQQGWFEGKVIQSLPERGKRYTVAYYGEDGKPKFFYTRGTGIQNNNAGKEIQTLIESGKYKIVQVANPENAGVRKFTDSGELVNYILTKDVQTRPLSWNQVEWRGGPHSMYDQIGFYAKQPQSWKTKLGRRVLGADKTWIFGSTREEVGKHTAAFNTAQQMLVDKVDDITIDAFVRANLPFDGVKDFRRQFKDFNDDAVMKLGTPLHVVGPGERVADVTDISKIWGNEEIVDIITDEHTITSGVNTKLSAHRDEALLTIDELGTTGNPQYQFRPMKTMDPIQSLDAATNQLVRDRHFDDLRQRNVEDWITEFEDILDMDKTILKGNPLEAMKHPKFKSGAPAAKVAQAKNARRNALYILQQETKWTTAFKAARESILDTVYKRGGKARADRLAESPWMWTENSDPLGMARSATFSAKLGMWNPRQLFMQAQGTFIVAGIDGNPVRAIQANIAANAMQWMYIGKMNKGFQNHVSKAAKALGLGEADFKEMYSVLEKTGLLDVGGEMANLDTITNTWFRNRFLKEVDRSGAPFRFGERHVRITAWNTAYLKWRSENPAAKLTPQVQSKLLARSHLIMGEMTRAANNPVLSRGPQTLFTQFFTFHTRMTELMIGGRLSGVERARLMGLMSGIYGVPAGGFGLAFGGFGVNQYEKQRELAMKYDVDLDSPWAKLYFNGIAGMTWDYILGEEYNIGHSYGPAGLNYLTQILDGDISALGGAAFNTLMDLGSGSMPLMYALWDGLKFDGETTWGFELTDVLPVLDEITTLSNAAKALYAYNTGLLITRDELAIADGSVKDAFMQGIFGLLPTHADDVFIEKDMLRDEKQGKIELVQAAEKYMNRAILALGDGNHEEFEFNYRRARSFLMGTGFTDQERLNFFKRNFVDNKTLQEKVKEEAWMRDKWGNLENYLEFQRKRMERYEMIHGD